MLSEGIHFCKFDSSAHHRRPRADETQVHPVYPSWAGRVMKNAGTERTKDVLTRGPFLAHIQSRAPIHTRLREKQSCEPRRLPPPARNRRAISGSAHGTLATRLCPQLRDQRAPERQGYALGPRRCLQTQPPLTRGRQFSYRRRAVDPPCIAGGLACVC